MKALTTALFLLVSGLVWGQGTFTLAECHRLAIENAPRLGDRELIRQMGELKVDQAGTTWYPSLNLNGKISYQSDVVTVALTDPTIPVEFPEVPHDQYGLNLDVSQNLYDGGIARTKKSYEEALTEADLQKVEVDLYGIKGKVNSYFFAILVLQENKLNLEIHMENLEAREEVMRTAIAHGTLLEAEIKVIEVEKLKVKQSMIEVESRKSSFMDALKVLCGETLSGNVVLETPQFEEYNTGQVIRPEHKLFDLKNASLEAGKELVGKKRMPVLYAFGQTGYGKPGYNMMSSDWDFYYRVGAGLRWNLWDWSHTKNEKQVIGYQQQVIQNQRATFDKELESILVQEEALIEQYRLTMEMEEQVVVLQQEISEYAAVKLANGTITATDYVTELNKESLARIRLATHQVQLMQAMANYLTIQGNL
ncbi:MAG: TolC family protein [Bacteroidales bacterium]|nr:TolC family protein [Bacteroidales bacterium]